MYLKTTFCDFSNQLFATVYRISFVRNAITERIAACCNDGLPAIIGNKITASVGCSWRTVFTICSYNFSRSRTDMSFFMMSPTERKSVKIRFN